MAEYQRIVSYLYKYNNGQKGENTGFVRVETRKDGLRLFFHIKDMKMMDERKLKAYFYFHKDGKKKGVFVDEFLCSRGNCEYKKTKPEESVEGFRELKDMDGMVFYDNRGLLYGTCWDEREINGEEIELPGMEDTLLGEKEKDSKKVKNKNNMSNGRNNVLNGINNTLHETENSQIKTEWITVEKKEDKFRKNEPESVEKEDTEKKEEAQKMEAQEISQKVLIENEETMLESELTEVKLQKEQEDKGEIEKKEVGLSSVERMLSQYPSVPIHWDSNLIEAVRIVPEDIAGFPMKDWKYAENGFLIQGYEIHHYLILGRIKMNPNRNLWVIGVPGIYNNREKYLAQIFGFYDYIPAEQGQLKTGGFGFWIAPLSYENR